MGVQAMSRNQKFSKTLAKRWTTTEKVVGMWKGKNTVDKAVTMFKASLKPKQATTPKSAAYVKGEKKTDRSKTTSFLLESFELDTKIENAKVANKHEAKELGPAKVQTQLPAPMKGFGDDTTEVSKRPKQKNGKVSFFCMCVCNRNSGSLDSP